jgi:hypothetical protein
MNKQPCAVCGAQAGETCTQPPRPTIDNAPGLIWRGRKHGWEARWQARSDIVKDGYQLASLRLWAGDTPCDIEKAFIAERCRALQDEMLTWSRGGLPAPITTYDGSWKSLVGCYQSDKDSPYQKLRYATKVNYDWECRQLLETSFTDENGQPKVLGNMTVAETRARTFLRLHEAWTEGGQKIAKGHGLIGMTRTLVNFGATMLECPECQRAAGALSGQRYEMPKPRTERLTSEQATAIRVRARAKGIVSMALAQAIQFECTQRQKDVIGEWVPMSEPGMSDVTDPGRGRKWLRGIRWEEVDENLIIRHITSKRQKPMEVNLRYAPMVMEELTQIYGEGFTRADLPASGPIIRHEETGLPYRKQPFNVIWREIADECGVPKSVYNMDTRAGAITEATEAGADLEHIKHAAGHSNISMTQRYARGGAEKTLGVMQKRAEYRNKTRT